MQNRNIERVLLISLPAILAEDEVENDFNISHNFNLGLAYLAGILRKNHIQVKILDCLVEDPNHIRAVEKEWREVGLSDRQILGTIGEFAPHLIGISIPFTYQHQMAMKLVQTIKLTFPDILIAVGGNHISAIPEQIDRDSINYLILGEGEYALIHLINAINECQPVHEIPGIVSKDTVVFQRAPFIQALDDLPFPAIDLLPLKKLWGKGPRWINMVATRGCVYDCVFCSIHTIMGNTIRRRSVENVVAEIKHWHSLYKVQEIYFEDDNLTTNRKWAKELFRQIAKNRFGIRFHVRNGIRADSIDRELIQLMKSAGFQGITIAPESGSQETLDRIIGKKMKLEDSLQAVRLASEISLHTSAFFVIGFPQESMEDIQATFSYARHLQKLGCAGFWFSLASPYPGTRLYDQCLGNNHIPQDIDYRRLRTAKSILINGTYSIAELESLRASIMEELKPPVLPIPEKIKKGVQLIVRDPSFFFSKFRYKLGIASSKYLNQRILRNAERFLAKDQYRET